MDEEIYIITRIDEDDYGCEARTDEYVPMVRVSLCSLEPDLYGNKRELTVMMEDSLMYARNLDEGNHTVIGMDGGLYPPGMVIPDGDLEDMAQVNRQKECMDAYFDAVDEMGL